MSLVSSKGNSVFTLRDHCFNNERLLVCETSSLRSVANCFLNTSIQLLFSLHKRSDQVDRQRENDGRILFGTDAGQGLQVTQLQGMLFQIRRLLSRPCEPCCKCNERRTSKAEEDIERKEMVTCNAEGLS